MNVYLLLLATTCRAITLIALSQWNLHVDMIYVRRAKSGIGVIRVNDTYTSTTNRRRCSLCMSAFAACGAGVLPISAVKTGEAIKVSKDRKGQKADFVSSIHEPVLNGVEAVSGISELLALCSRRPRSSACPIRQLDKLPPPVV